MNQNCSLIKENCYDTKSKTRKIILSHHMSKKMHAKQCTWQTKCFKHVCLWLQARTFVQNNCRVQMRSHAVYPWFSCRENIWIVTNNSDTSIERSLSRVLFIFVTICAWHNDDKCFDVLFDASHILRLQMKCFPK